ncbi:MAG: peptidylprolyl isomerase [Clostridiales Family XIII bacterium]|jgi:foldase protein PrsA|nr:peptidylprolyl isomerase [Clostridiales Family XIII bacterium]
MKRTRKLFAVAICLILAASLSFAACGKSSGNAGGFKGDAVAKVGDTTIASDLMSGVSGLILYMYYGPDSMDTFGEDEMKYFSNQILLDILVRTEVMRAHLAESGNGKLTSDEKKAAKDNVALFLSTYGVTQDSLDALGITESHINYYFEGLELYTKFLDEVKEADPVTDEEVEEYYKTNTSSYLVPLQVRASHILVQDKEHTPESLEKAEQILEKAKAGDDFSELAKEYSDDTSAESGGDVGYFDETTSFVAEFKEAAFALQVDEISDVVETEFGYHIIKVTERTETHQQTLDEVRETISDQLLETEHLETFYSEVEAAMVSANLIEYYIDVDPETGKPPTSPPATDIPLDVGDTTAEETPTADTELTETDPAAEGEGEAAADDVAGDAATDAADTAADGETPPADTETVG